MTQDGMTRCFTTSGVRCCIAESPASALDYINGLTKSDFRGYDPLFERPDLHWIGRSDLKNQGVGTSKDVCLRIGEYVEKDHQQISSARNKLADLVDSIDLSQLKRMLQWSDSRGRVNATRLLQGDSHFRRTIRKSQAPVEAVALVVPTGANCGVSAETIFARTAVALAASELLQEAGFAVEVWAYAFTQGCYRDSKDKNGLAAMRLKSADEPTNEAIAASGGSAWWFRTGFFAMWSAQGDAKHSLGHSRNLTDNEVEVVREAIGLEQAHLMRRAGDVSTVEAAIREGIEDIKEALTKWVGNEQ